MIYVKKNQNFINFLVSSLHSISFGEGALWGQQVLVLPGPAFCVLYQPPSFHGGSIPALREPSALTSYSPSSN